MAKSKDLRREIVVAKFQLLLDAIAELDGNTDEIEAKLDAIVTLLTSLDGKDYATETTLLALETTANAIEILLTSIDGKDFSTETTLNAVKLQTDKLTFTGGDLNVNATIPPITVGANQWDASAGNTSTTPLGIGGLFTGVVETSDFSDVMVHIETDQDGTLFFDFTQDGVNFDTFPFTGFAHIAGIPSFHIAVKGGQQFRIRFDNTSGVAQNYFRAYTYYGDFKKPNAPLGSILTDDTDAIVTHSSLTGKDKTGVYKNVLATPSGNLQITNIDSQTGSNQIVDLNGAAKFGEAIILVGDVFGNNTPNPLQWDEEFVGSGAIINQPGSLRVETSTTANSEVRFQSTKKARFMLSQFNIFHCGLQLDNLADANCERRFGVFDPINPSQNGAYFALIDGDWNVGYCKNGVETLVPQAIWNGTNKDLFNDSTALSPYEIHYNAGSIFFFQRGNFLHRVGGLPDPYASEYNFKVAVEVINKNGNTNNNGVDLYALGAYRLGEERGEPISRVFNADTLIKSSAGYVKNAYLSRTGSGGGSANLVVYDGLDATGVVMARVDIGADDFKGLAVDSTFSEGLYIEINGTGTINATISYE